MTSDRADPGARRGGAAPSSTASTCSGSLSPSRAGDFMTCPLLTATAPSTGCPSRRRPTRCAAPSCTRCSRTSSTCRGRPHPRPGRRAAASRPGSRSSRPSPRSPRCSAPRGPRSAPGWRPARSPWAATSPSRTRPGSSRPSASCTSRRCSSPSCCCAASSTGSTSRPTGRSGWSTTRPAGRPARRSRPRRCSR